MFSNLSRAEIYDRKVKGKSIYKIELKSTTFVKLTCVIINCNNFRARIFNQIQIPARETSRSLGSRLRRSLFEIDLWASLAVLLCRLVTYTCKSSDLQTSCNKVVDKPISGYVRALFSVVATSMEQVIILLQG